AYVEELHHNRSDHFHEVAVAGGPAGLATGAHPFWESRLATWLPARSLVAGSLLASVPGEPVEVTATALPNGEPRPPYSLSVGRYHTYFVGPGVLVQNNGLSPPLGGPIVIYRGFLPGQQANPSAPVYVGQTDQGISTRQGQHRAEAIEALRSQNLTPAER